MLLSAYYKLYITGLMSKIQSDLPHINLLNKSYSVPAMDARVATTKIFGDVKVSDTGLRTDATKEYWTALVHTRQLFQTLVGNVNSRIFRITTDRNDINETIGCRFARQIIFEVGTKFISNQPLNTDDIISYRLTELANINSFKVTIDIDGVAHELSIQLEMQDIDTEDFLQGDEASNLYSISWFTKVTCWVISPNKINAPYIKTICANIWANYDGSLEIDRSDLRTTIEIN